MNILTLSDDEKIISAHVGNCIERCYNTSSIQFTDFLSDRERFIALETARSLGASDFTVAFGGYDDAERCIVGFLPEYMLHCEMCDIKEEFPIIALCVKCSGFKQHNHRDFLGSVLALGLKRAVIGDIIVEDSGYGAVIFVHNRVADFICENLKLIGRDGVKVYPALENTVTEIKRKFETIKCTGASLRLDAIISEVLNISREKSQAMISQGLVTVNHEEMTEKNKSKTLELSDVFTVRGSGKFRLSLIGDRNRKDRIRFEVEKYI